MLYCFVWEDIVNLSKSDPLYLQVDYAKRLGKFICCELESKTIKDFHFNQISILGKSILLRATCDTASNAIQLITDSGGNVLETENDIKKIENWETIRIAQRSIISITRNDLMTKNFDSETYEFLHNHQRVFIKSRKKGVSLTAPSELVLRGDKRLKEILMSEIQNDDLLMSKCYDINKDSLGKKEARFFVFNGSIINASRTLHSVKHSVPKSFLTKAEDIVKHISMQKDFPLNYVLDLAEFIENSNRFIDVLELNPITSSLCYINNSIFNESVPEIDMIHRTFGAGYEFCYDALSNPERYVLSRGFGENYEYINTGHYDF